MNPDTSVDNARPASMLALTAKIVAAYTQRNAMPGSELPALIDRVFQSLSSLATGSVTPAPQVRPDPAVPVRKSVFADYIVCLEDGKKMKMLKRHLMTSYGLTPQAYRERWGLP
ncbi:MAG: MucR family transcriptional regulator, partial [Janthinobacterium lividum]